MSDPTHGIEVLEIDGGARPITTIRTSIIGLVGTASQGPLNTPVLITGQKNAAETFGTGGSIAAALEAIYAQVGALVIAVNVLDPANTSHATDVANESLGSGHVINDVIALANQHLTELTSLVQDPAGARYYACGGHRLYGRSRRWHNHFP